MEENIEVKDVQKTEYLDKNGLDMLWTKVKENTHNQVEVERNRAVAKEDNITNSLSEFASKTTADGQYFRADVHSYDTIGTFSKKHSLGTAWLSDYNGNPRLTIRNPERMNNQTILTTNELFITGYYGSQITISPDGVKMQQKTTKDIVTANNSTAHIGLDDDQAEYAYVAPLENGKVPAKYLDLPQIDTTVFALKSELDSYAKKTDIPEVDTSDFVSKSATDDQIINSTLGVVGGEILLIPSMDNTDINATLAPNGLEFNGGDRSTIELNSSSLDGQSESKIIIETYNENPNIVLRESPINDTAFQRTLTITNEGISNTDNNANHVYATDGSIADLTQYAKKSEISAGGNVDDVQVNGVSVVENKIANIKPATKENLGVVKVGDGLNVTDGTISVDTTAIGTGNYISYRDESGGLYNLPYGASLRFKKDRSTHNSTIVRPGAIQTMSYDATNTTISIGGNEEYYFKGIRLYTDGNDRVTLDDHSFTIFDGTGSNVYDVVKLNADGIKLHNGDNNHVLTSNASTIDITQYVLKSVYDEKIAALEARIAALEAKHTETA